MYQQIGSLRTGQTSSEISEKNKVRMDFKRQKKILQRFPGEVQHPLFKIVSFFPFFFCWEELFYFIILFGLK